MPTNIYYGDPGPCPVDDAPHTTCTSATATTPIVIAQTPMRDASAAAELAALAHTQNSGQALPPDSFTTATYKRKR